MSIELEIQDGFPNWWNSPDIWIVPGNDPAGSPGPPIAGQNAYLWGRVRNNGKTSANSAQVNFYWSNPATGVLRSNSTLIGSSFVSLDPGEIQEVLCLTPWIPIVVNDGHECVVAEVIHVLDPLPSPLTDAFDPPTHKQIAQRNLSVLLMDMLMIVMPIQLSAPAREKKTFEIKVELGNEINPKALLQLGISNKEYCKEPMVKVALSLDKECERVDAEKNCTNLKVNLMPGTSKAVYLKVDPVNLKQGKYSPINVIAREGGNIVGGITYVAIQSKKGGKYHG